MWGEVVEVGEESRAEARREEEAGNFVCLCVGVRLK